jgi:hypothetical protein
MRHATILLNQVCDLYVLLCYSDAHLALFVVSNLLFLEWLSCVRVRA